MQSASLSSQCGARYLQRACIYYHIGERFLQPKTEPGLEAYRRGVDCLRYAAQSIKRPRLEHVNRGGKVPAMVLFDGLDITKEIQFFKGISDLARRGVLRA